MDFNQLLQQLGGQASVFLPLVAVIVGLFVAWVVGRFGAFIVKRIFERLQVDERASKSLDTKTQITRWVSGATFWLLFVFVLWQLATLASRFIGIPESTVDPLGALFNEWLPRLVNVAIFFAIAWLVASLLRFLVVKVLDWTRLDERLGEQVADKKSAGKMNESIGRAIFWLTFLVFMPSILGSLGLGQVAESVQGLVAQMIGYIPGIIGAILILILGGLLARIVRQIVTGFLEGIGVDRLGERIGLSRSNTAQPLSALLGTVVYILVLIPVVVQALDVLQLPVISSIGAQLLSGVTGLILNVLGAAVILSVAYYIAKFIGDIVASLLAGLGINRLPSALGFKTAKDSNVSNTIGYIVLVAVMLFAIQGTADNLGLTSIAALVGSLITFAGNVLLGIVIFLAGIYLANLASNVITSTGGEETSFLANLVRWAILIFVAGIALNQAGVTLAANVIQIALIAIGAAAALAFGLGGREAAAKQMERWFASASAPSVKSKKTEKAGGSKRGKK
ncbi:MAG: mechanosensitive ion channel [Chloroflexi bacterium]|nr:mechanosensitive ion channel [Chloroflexota bacterium]